MKPSNDSSNTQTKNVQTKEDAKFHTALENMRYRDCTSNDIAFLRMRIAGPGPNRPKLAQKRFRNISMITTWNAQKDKLGCIRFAEDVKQALTTFYSHDTWAEYESIDESKGRRKRCKEVKYTHSSTNTTEDG